MGLRSTLALVALLAAGPAPQSAPASLPDLLERALPSVVLLLNPLPDGRLGYGDRDLLEKFGMKIDRRVPGDPNRELLRLGIRVEAVSMVGEDGAWVIIAGRNADDTRWKYSEFLRRRDAKWVLGIPPPASIAAKRPKDWPPPLQDLATAEARERAGIEQMLVALEGAP